MKFIMIDWNIVVKKLGDGDEVTTDPSRWNLSNSEYKKIYDQWEQANFNMGAVKWINYYPGKHFDQNIVDEVSKSLTVKTHRAWISRIDPGYFAPWHWDVEDNITEYESKGKIKRFSIFVSESSPGHFFTVDNKVFFNYHQGEVYEWKDYNAWHAGANAGLKPKYMFHLLGY